MVSSAMTTPKNDRAWQQPLISAHQLRIGDVARTPNGGEWEVREVPKRRNGGQTIEARVQRPGDSRALTMMSWPSAEFIHVRRPTRPPSA